MKFTRIAVAVGEDFGECLYALGEDGNVYEYFRERQRGNADDHPAFWRPLNGIVALSRDDARVAIARAEGGQS